MRRGSFASGASRLLLALLGVVTIAAGCTTPSPGGQLLVQRTDPATTRALVFVPPDQGSLTAPLPSAAPHFRIRNVGEPGSRLRVSVSVPAGMSANVGTRTLSAGDGVNVTLSASGASRDALVRVSAGAEEVVVPVRIVSDVEPVCDAAAGSASRTMATPPPGARSADAGAAPSGFEVLVRYDATIARSAGLPEVARRQLTERAVEASGAQLLRPGGLAEHDLLWVRDASALESLRRAPGVTHAVPNVRVHRLGLPNDPHLADQWWALGFGAAQGWAVTSGGDADLEAPRVVVAIVDDGINTDHEDLRGTTLAGCDVFDVDDDVRFSGSDHGTHVAGLAGATGDNGVGIAGVAYGPQVQLLPVKVFPDDALGSGTLDAVVRGLLWSAGREVYGLGTNPAPADVINMSFGFGTDPLPSVISLLQAFVDDLHDGSGPTKPVLVAAAGNTGANRVEYPARLEGVIAVGSVNHDLTRSAFSNNGTGLDLMAPGGIGPSGNACGSAGLRSLGARSATSLVCQAGTSMAAPIVTGSVALLMLHDPSLRDDPDAVLNHLIDRAYRPAGWSPAAFGAGIVCLDAVLDAGSSCATYAPSP